MTVFPRDKGRPVTKSREIWDHGRGGSGNECNNLAGCWHVALLAAQAEQDLTKSVTSLIISGHQNCCIINRRVRLIPGWQAILELCPHYNTSERRRGGHPARTKVSSWALSILRSISHLSASMMQWSGRKLSFLRLDRKFVIVRRVWCSSIPCGLLMWNVYRVNNRAQRAW